MNKTYKTILLTLLTGLSVASCDSYEAPALTSAPAVTIVTRDTDFPASASTGSITFKADGPVTVSTTNQWITATVEGDEIKISCTQNTSLQSRTGSIVVKCGDRTTEISIMQEGVIFQLSDGVENVTFDAGKSSKELTFKTNAPIEATSDSEWLTADINDGILTINVDNNISLDNRSGNLKLTSGSNEWELGITQSGISYPIFNRTEWYPGDTRNYWNMDYPFDMDIEFSSTDPEWINHEWDQAKKKLYINAQKNETGHVRTGSFTYTIGPKSGSMWVHQCDFLKDLVSDDYLLVYTKPSDGKTYYTSAIISWNTFRRIELPDYGLKFQISYDSDSHTISIAGGESCGTWKGYETFTLMGYEDEEGPMLTWNEDASLSALPDYEFVASDNAGYTTLGFKDGGTYDYPVTELIIGAFTTSTPSGASYAGYLLDMVNPVLIRAHEVAAVSTFSLKRSARMTSPISSTLRSALPAPAPALEKGSRFKF